LQKCYKGSTTSPRLCNAFFEHIIKVRCKVCREWCESDTCRVSDDFLCLRHATSKGAAAAGASPAKALENKPTSPAAAAAATAAASSSSAEKPPAVKPLPYDPKALEWNDKRTQNKEGKYCYCGKNKPQCPCIQCALCKNWFHLDCTSGVVPKDGLGFLPFQLNYGAKNATFEPFIYRNDHFTKTGSGQT